MIQTLRSALASLFQLLPVQVSDNDGAELSPPVQQAVPVNFVVVVLNGLFFPTAQRILGPGLLLTWFVTQLTPAALWVGLIVPVQQGLALLAQPFVAEWLTGKPRRSRYYTAQGLLRAALWAALGLGVWLIGRNQPSLLLVLFFLTVGIDAAAGGLGNIAFNDVIARTIPPRVRGQARGYRGILGGLATAAAGYLIRTSFSERSSIAAFGLVFGVAGLCYAAGGLLFALIDEPADPQAERAHPGFGQLLQHVRQLLDDRMFRWFIIVQALLVPLIFGLPFFTLFARRSFGLDIKAIGLLIIVDAATPILANAVWGRLADRWGNRGVISAAAGVGLLAPLCGGVLLLMRQGGWFVFPLLALIVGAIGAALVGVDLATKNYLLDLAPDATQRPLYIGVNDTVVGLPALLLVGVGPIIDRVGFAPVFAAIGIMAAGAALLATRLRKQANDEQGQ